jgi:DNA-binding winged helix-turn-helix (wHTH) protein
MPAPRNRIQRFGVFEINLDAGELRKNGVKLRLQGQPFQVLALLLQRTGEVVTREEIQQELWPSDIFVDFDHSLNTAINKVREVLGDSASSPLYIETLARKGYRFLAPVQTDTSEAPPPTSDKEQTRSKDRSPAGVLHPELQVPIPRRAVTRGLFALIQVMYLAFYVSALLRIHGVETLADSILPPQSALLFTAAVMVTAGVGIPLRCFLLSAVGFDYQPLGEVFRKMFPYVLALDGLWAVAPFLLMRQIGIGAAFAACAALLYVPFSERTLIRMAYFVPPGPTSDFDGTNLTNHA